MTGFEVCGNPFEPTYTTPKILWYQRYKPDIYHSTYKFLQCNSYIVYKLTGKITQDISQGYGLHFFDIQTGQWDGKLSEVLGIPLEKLPDIHLCHEVVGEVTRQAAEECGLYAGIPVVAGGLDAACGTLGAGVVPGQTQEQGGQAGGMSICQDRAAAHPKLILSYMLFLVYGFSRRNRRRRVFKWFRQSRGMGRSTGKGYGHKCFSDYG